MSEMKGLEMAWTTQDSGIMSNILEGSLQSLRLSGIPMDPKYYDTIDKIRLLGLHTGKIILEGRLI